MTIDLRYALAYFLIGLVLVTFASRMLTQIVQWTPYLVSFMVRRYVLTTFIALGTLVGIKHHKDVYDFIDARIERQTDDERDMEAKLRAMVENPPPEVKIRRPLDKLPRRDAWGETEILIIANSKTKKEIVFTWRRDEAQSLRCTVNGEEVEMSGAQKSALVRRVLQDAKTTQTPSTTLRDALE